MPQIDPRSAMRPQRGVRTVSEREAGGPAAVRTQRAGGDQDPAGRRLGPR
jgi:hypothetical protein